MKNQIGFVVLGGTKIFITVREGRTSRWVSARWVGGQEGGHLPTIERALKKIKGVREKLLDGKMQAL